MKIIKQDNTYLEEADVLVRVYGNQDPDHDEKDQICAEVLFRPYLNLDHLQATSWLPRGAVAFIVQTLNEYHDKPWTVQISNELDNNIGVLTSCRANFDNSMEWQSLKAKP